MRGLRAAVRCSAVNHLMASWRNSLLKPACALSSPSRRQRESGARLRAPTMDESITLGATPKNADCLRLFKTGENKPFLFQPLLKFFSFLLKSQVLPSDSLCAALNAKKKNTCLDCIKFYTLEHQSRCLLTRAHAP